MRIKKSDIEKIERFCDRVDQVLAEAESNGLPPDMALELVQERTPQAYQVYSGYQQIKAELNAVRDADDSAITVLDDMVRERMDDHGEDVATATATVVERHPELYDAYCQAQQKNAMDAERAQSRQNQTDLTGAYHKIGRRRFED